MAYELIINENEKKIEVHYDLCDGLLEKKENPQFNNEVMYLSFMNYNEVEEFLKNHDRYETLLCEICKPFENREEYDEEYDDFYEEFDDEDDIDNSRCDIF